MTQTRKRGAAPADALPLPLFRALADPNRIALVSWLAGQSGPRTVSEIFESGCCPVDFSVVSRHLRMLHAAGALTVERSGREVRYELGTPSLVQKLRQIADVLEQCCPIGRRKRRRRLAKRSQGEQA